MKKELMPTDCRKSFYGKAYVEDDGKCEVLFSYGTRIMSRNKMTGELTAHWDGWSATTGRHIKAFCGLNKSGYNALLDAQRKAA